MNSPKIWISYEYHEDDYEDDSHEALVVRTYQRWYVLVVNIHQLDVVQYIPF